MTRNYYVLKNGRVRRENNTVYIEDADGKKTPLPVENIESLYLYGEVDLNTRLLNFLATKRITLHVFNYYGYYSGSYYPRDYLHSGFLLVRQAEHYGAEPKRVALAKEFVRGAAHSLLRNVLYYERRRERPATASDVDPPGEIGVYPDAPIPPTAIPADAESESAIDAAMFAPLVEDEDADPFAPPPDDGPDADETAAPAVELSRVRLAMEKLSDAIDGQSTVASLLGIEGKMRQRYYAAWEHLLVGDWAFSRRVRRPPDNEVNSLISFGNGLLYSVCLAEIYRTHLTPTVSFLHEPGVKRFSLALDLSEIFKPLIVDRAIFTLLNKGQLKKSHFDRDTGGCFLNDDGRKLFIGEIEKRLATTIKHRRLNRSVTYRHLIRLECYKLIRHLSGLETYKAFRAWW
jgi:CRISPR/Cas system-associated endonuclease Cas1